jgi:hypothetical protein
MGRDQSDAGYEWVNAWAASATAVAPAVSKDEPAPTPKSDPGLAPPGAAAPFPSFPPDQLMRDIGEIERARDALDALPLVPRVSTHLRMQALTLVPSRTSDMVPVVIGGVLALVMLTVFGAAAAMTKLAR